MQEWLDGPWSSCGWKLCRLKSEILTWHSQNQMMPSYGRAELDATAFWTAVASAARHRFWGSAPPDAKRRGAALPAAVQDAAASTSPTWLVPQENGGRVGGKGGLDGGGTGVSPVSSGSHGRDARATCTATRPPAGEWRAGGRKSWRRTPVRRVPGRLQTPPVAVPSGELPPVAGPASVRASAPTPTHPRSAEYAPREKAISYQ